MKFEEIMSVIREGNAVVNTNWNGLKNGKDMFIRAQLPDENSMNTEPYIVFVSDEKVFPWTPSALDLWSEGWEVRGETKE